MRKNFLKFEDHNLERSDKHVVFKTENSLEEEIPDQ